MPARALLVLLLILNLGLASWWLLRPEPPVPPAWAPPEGVPRLQLLDEDGEAPAAAPVAADVSTADASVEGLACFGFGPFAEAAEAEAARVALEPLGAVRTAMREVVEGASRWRVLMAGSERAAADALAARIREAGLSDVLVVQEGEASVVALGLYGSEAAAGRRIAALREAGFEAQVQPLGDVRVRHWLDVAAPPDFDAGAAREAAGAADVQELDCAVIVVADAPR